MNLQFGNNAEPVYKKWKDLADHRYSLLKSVILDSLQHPYEGLGDPRLLHYGKKDFWCRSFGERLSIIYSIEGDSLRIQAISDVPSAAVVCGTAEQHDEAINLMKRFMDGGKPKLGIFWYDYNSNKLFGVEKGDADLYSSQGQLSTYPKLHKTYWQKMHHKAVATGDVNSIFYSEHDYTQIPRGRVFLENGEYYITVGDWINGKVNGKECIDKEALRELLIEEFNLPEDVTFRQDVHWDIGHGWSEEQI